MYDPKTARFHSFSENNDTPRVVLERFLETLERLEPKVRAFVCLDIEGARRAADASTARRRAGTPLSAIDGLPVGIKDCFDVRGFPTRVNSAYFDDVSDAATDAAHVDALRRGGAIIVGKTVTTELTMAAPGPTWNPWDLTRTPGGSSSGSAAAVAAGMLPIATGIALSIKRAGGTNRVFCFMGEMTSETGIAHECVKYARNHDLPIHFIVEDNGKSVCTDTRETWAQPRLTYEESTDPRITYYRYETKYPHAGAGKRVQF